MAALLHAMYDPDHPIDRLIGMTPRHAWPAELDVTSPTHLAAKTFENDDPDSWCHATAWVKAWPLTPVGVNFLAPLLVHTPDVIRTVAVVMDLEPTEVAINRMLTEKTNDDAESNRAARMGHVADPPTGHTPVGSTSAATTCGGRGTGETRHDQIVRLKFRIDLGALPS